MTKVAILPVSSEKGAVSYLALAGDKHSQGSTVGEALDALTPQLSIDEAGTLIIVQSLRPDRLFNAEQQQKLAELMKRWRVARDRGETLPVAEQSELETLVEAELHAAGRRAEVLGDELSR